MIDIIIPAYNAHKFILDVLYNIASQSISEKINVYVVNDCSEKDYKEQIDKVNKIINVKEICTPKNVGPGGARQYGLDNSSSEFIMFIDADDLFNDALSVESLYSKIATDENYDIVVSNFNEQTKDLFFPHTKNDIWMHGKIYRRSFLNKYNIRFNNSRANEDTGFNKLCFMVAKIGYFDIYTYIWRYNHNSITRVNNHEYSFTGIEGYLYNIEWAVKEAEKRKFPKECIARTVYNSIIVLFYDYLLYCDEKEKQNKIAIWTKNLKKIYLKYKKLITEEQNDDFIKAAISKGLHYNKGEKYLYNADTFTVFLKQIDKLTKKENN